MEFPEALVKDLRDRLLNIVDRQGPVMRPQDPEWKGRVLCCSDAMNERAGACIFDEAGEVCWWDTLEWTGDEGSKHINVKETLAGLWCAKEVLKRKIPTSSPWALVLGVDNTTAQVILNSACLSTDPLLTAAVLILHEGVEHRGGRLMVVRIPGDKILADQFSRLEDKAQWLEEAMDQGRRIASWNILSMFPMASTWRKRLRMKGEDYSRAALRGPHVENTGGHGLV